MGDWQCVPLLCKIIVIRDVAHRFSTSYLQVLHNTSLHHGDLFNILQIDFQAIPTTPCL